MAMGEIMVPVQIDDVLEDLEDEDLLHELRRRGVTAVRAQDRMDQLVSELRQTYALRDDMHFGVLLERLRSLAAS